MTPDENKITRLASELAQLIYKTLGESTNVQKSLKEIEHEGYHIEMVLSAAIGSSSEKLSPYLIREILSNKHIKTQKTQLKIRSEYSDEDINFLKSLKIQIAKETSE